MLSSLEIENFRGIRQGKLEELAQVNVLVGRNNSGKSTVLDALILLREPFCSVDYLGNGLRQILGRRTGEEGTNFDELWFRVNTQVPVTLRARCAGDSKFEEEWGRGLSVVIRAKTQRWDGARGSGGHVRDYPQGSAAAPYLRQVIDELEMKHIALLHLLDPTSIRSAVAEHLWQVLAIDRRDREVVRLINEIYQSNVEFFSRWPFAGRDRLVASLPQTSVGLDWLGDGLRYALNILALGVLLEGTALLVEELETHQHPESLRMLTRTLFQLAKQQRLQLFLTTHSMEFITYALEAAQEQGLDLKLHHLSLDQEGTLRVTSMSQPSAQLLLDIGHDPRLHYKYTGAG